MYIAIVGKKGRTKMFMAQPAFLDNFLRQPKELLEKRIIPLEKILKVMLKERSSTDHLRSMLTNIETLKCILQNNRN